MQHQTQERQAWINQQQMRAAHSGATPVEGAGTFAAPEVLPPPDDQLTLGALHRVIRAAQSPVGVVAGPVRELGQSPNWNALAGGVPPEPRHSIATDALVARYLDQREEEVAKSAFEVRKLFPGVIKRATEGVKDGIQQGYVPSEVAARLPSLDQTTVRVVDAEIIRDEASRAGADYDVSTDEIRIGHDAVSHPKIRRLILHELTHKLIGGTFAQDTESGEYRRTRSGFSNMERTNQRIGLGEAADHHVTLGIETGDFETLDPDKREDGDRIYYGARKVVATAWERSGGVMEVRALARASFEDTTPGAPTTDERRVLVRQAVQAYGPGALRKIDDLAVAAETIDPGVRNYTEQLQALTSRIHAPELNGDGTVQKPGSIDIKDL